MDRDDEDYNEGYIAESHPLRPTHLSVPLGGRSDSRAPSISSSVSDLDVPALLSDWSIRWVCAEARLPVASSLSEFAITLSIITNRNNYNTDKITLYSVIF